MVPKKLWFLLAVILLLLTLCNARGGGRRGGSSGGFFKSLRKLKKSSAGGGNSRRIVSSQPVYTPISKAVNEKKKSISADKFSSKYYSKQSFPHIPPNGAYYSSAASLPNNAVYISQAPPRGSGR